MHDKCIDKITFEGEGGSDEIRYSARLALIVLTLACKVDTSLCAIVYIAKEEREHLSVQAEQASLVFKVLSFVLQLFLLLRDLELFLKVKAAVFCLSFLSTRLGTGHLERSSRLVFVATWDRRRQSCGIAQTRMMRRKRRRWCSL